MIMLYPRVLGNKLTQKDNADSGVQFITPAGPRQSLLLAKDPDQHLWKSFIPHVYVSEPTTPNPLENTIPITYHSRAMCSCGQTVKQLANNQGTRVYTPIDTEKFMACLEEGVISVCFLLGDE